MSTCADRRCAILLEVLWPADVWADAARKARVEQQLAALDAALAIAWAAAAAAPAGSDARYAAEAAAAVAYDALCCDTQMFLGLQPHTWDAFTPLFGRPIETTSFTDTLNGRTRAHWFYAVTTRARLLASKARPRSVRRSAARMSSPPRRPSRTPRLPQKAP